MALSFTTSGQSHGPGIVAVLSGLPAGLEPDRDRLQRDLARRQAGYGRSPRQAIETDEATILGGMRHGRTLGGPIALMIANRDHANWGAAQSAWPVTDEELAEVHDELRFDDGYRRDSNRAGGLEGGMTNGEPVVVRIAMKPLPTLMKPLKTATLDTHEPAEALVERSDTTAIYAAAVVAEAVIAFELARAAKEKFGGDAVGDFAAAHAHYLSRIPWSPA